MPFTLPVTNAGRAALVNAAKDGTNAVRVAAVGVSATAFVASAATTALPGEIKRISTISGDAVAADTIHVTVRDESNGGYSVRSIALYLADGTLFAAYGQSDVLVEKSAQAMLLLALDVRFADIAAASLTFGDTNFLNPPATAEMQGVVELATDAETAAGTDDRRAVTPKSLNFTLSARLSTWGSDIWRASNDGAGSGMDADLLDGQQGSYYANIPARLGYMPASRTGDAFTGNVGITNGAILYHEASAGNFGVVRYQRQNQVRWDIGMNIVGESGGNAGSDFFISRFDDAGNFLDTAFSIERSSGKMRAGGGILWHANNDGAGSGLDADLLDGRDSSYFAPVAYPAFSGTIATFADGRLLVQHDGSDAYVRPLNGSGSMWLGAGNTNVLQIMPSGLVKIAGFTAWHSGNDGAGSGLDADLLDGQDSSFYTNIVARLGYAPANRGGDTLGRMTFAAGSTGGNGVGASNSDLGELEVRGNGVGAAMVTFHRPNSFAAYLGLDVDNQLKLGGWSFGPIAYTIWHAGNDGAGSGMDADLLDGQDSSYYANVVARLGFWPVRQGTGIGQLSNVVHIGWSGTRVKVTIDSSDMGNVVFDNHIADVWRVSNDGAGSGLDADLLDGRQASDFVLQNDGSRFGSNGNGYWERRPNGVIEQWGTITGPLSEGQAFVTFPIHFTDENSISISATGVNNFANNRFDITIQRVSRSIDGCSLMVQYTAASTSINQIDAIDWRAVGR